jgi:hypothetical protein
MNSKGRARKRAWFNVGYYPDICLKELKKPTIKFSQHIRSPDWDLKSRPRIYNTKWVLSTRRRRKGKDFIIQALTHNDFMIRILPHALNINICASPIALAWGRWMSMSPRSAASLLNMGNLHWAANHHEEQLGQAVPIQNTTLLGHMLRTIICVTILQQGARQHTVRCPILFDTITWHWTHLPTFGSCLNWLNISFSWYVYFRTRCKLQSRCIYFISSYWLRVVKTPNTFRSYKTFRVRTILKGNFICRVYELKDLKYPWNKFLIKY